MKSKPILLFLCFLISCLGVAQTTSQGKTVTPSTVPAALSGVHLVDGNSDPEAGTIGLLAYDRSGKFQIISGTLDNLSRVQVPDSVTNYVTIPGTSGVFRKTSIRVRGERVYFTTSLSTTFATTEIFKVENHAVSSLLRIGQTVIAGGQVTTVTKLGPYGVSPDAKKEWYWMSVNPYQGVLTEGLFEKQNDGSFILRFRRLPSQVSLAQDYPILVTKDGDVLFNLILTDQTRIIKKLDKDGKESEYASTQKSYFGQNPSDIIPQDGVEPAMQIAYNQGNVMVWTSLDLNTYLWGRNNYSGGEFPRSSRQFSWAGTHGVLPFYSSSDKDFNEYLNLMICETGACSLFSRAGSGEIYGKIAFAFKDGITYMTVKESGTLPDGAKRYEPNGMFKIEWPIISTAKQIAAKQVEITGHNFDKWGTPRVEIAGYNCDVLSSSATKIVVQMPSTMNGISGNVTVQVFSGNQFSAKFRTDLISAPAAKLTGPTYVEKGNPAELTWNTQGAEKVRIEARDANGNVLFEKEVGPNGSDTFPMEQTTEFFVVATGIGGTTEQSVTVGVVELPVIEALADGMGPTDTFQEGKKVRIFGSGLQSPDSVTTIVVFIDEEGVEKEIKLETSPEDVGPNEVTFTPDLKPGKYQVKIKKDTNFGQFESNSLQLTIIEVIVEPAQAQANKLEGK